MRISTISESPTLTTKLQNYSTSSNHLPDSHHLASNLKHKSSVASIFDLMLLLLAMIPSMLLWVVGICVAFYLHRRYILVKIPRVAKPTLLYRDPVRCRDMLGKINPLGNWSSAGALLQSRATPNTRLVEVFGIDNPFTTTQVAYHRQFLKNTRAILNRDSLAWERVRDAALKFVLPDKKINCDSAGFLLVPIVQNIVLKISLYAMFELTDDELDDGDIKLIAETINSLWLKSKSTDLTGVSVCSEQQALRGALRGIFPEMGDAPRDNPLNLILPAYETLWRAVLRGFIEVSFRNRDRRSEWQSILLKFLATPTQASFDGKSFLPHKISVRMIAAETLRLYPPTRRIYRQVTLENALEPQLVAADIEYMHRDPRIWGEDSLSFNPLRWENIAQTCLDAYMPFGSRPFVCPAEKAFGPRMIGILVAALVSKLEGSSWMAEEQQDAIPDNCTPLKLGRDCYRTLRVLPRKKD
ncbi:MAG: hypothetical protein M1829_000191 [Trizodia sp. TS-e1964]|nr:MAG: hypothetical protein M1829_000191 [Trizodia sp. TS-e1964]